MTGLIPKQAAKKNRDADEEARLKRQADFVEKTAQAEAIFEKVQRLKGTALTFFNPPIIIDSPPPQETQNLLLKLLDEIEEQSKNLYFRDFSLEPNGKGGKRESHPYQYEATALFAIANTARVDRPFAKQMIQHYRDDLDSHRGLGNIVNAVLCLALGIVGYFIAAGIKAMLQKRQFSFALFGTETGAKLHRLDQALEAKVAS